MASQSTITSLLIRVSELKISQNFKISNAARRLHRIIQVEPYLKTLPPYQEMSIHILEKRFKTKLNNYGSAYLNKRRA